MLTIAPSGTTFGVVLMTQFSCSNVKMWLMGVHRLQDQKLQMQSCACRLSDEKCCGLCCRIDSCKVQNISHEDGIKLNCWTYEAATMNPTSNRELMYWTNPIGADAETSLFSYIHALVFCTSIH
eukprot:scaffold2646_cov42-Cyclotella_meneghiniana.AAC.8